MLTDILPKNISPNTLFASREKTVAKVSEETKLLEHFYNVYLSKKCYNIELQREIKFTHLTFLQNQYLKACHHLSSP